MIGTPSLRRLQRSDEREELDRSGHDRALLAGTLTDIRRVNRWLRGTRLTLRALDRLAATVPRGSSLSVLDVGTGTADIPAAIVVWARERGLRPRVVGVDVSGEILSLADAPDVELVLADARSLPFDDESFDVATCSLLLHHLAADDVVAVLREMRRVSRQGVIANDLVRGWFGYVGAWTLSRTLTSNPLTRKDAPLSVRRSYTTAELAELAQRAALGRVEFLHSLGYRTAMTAGRS